MPKRSFNILNIARHDAAAWCRALADRVQILVFSFPSLRDAFDADDLPLAFILKRDSRAGDPTSGRRNHSTLGPHLRGASGAHNVQRTERRADARSTLRANADRGHRATSLTASDSSIEVGPQEWRTSN